MDKMHDRHRNNQEGIAYTLLKFSLPLIFSGILQQLYNWADAFIVGNVEGELALAAIGATGTVVNFYLMAITGFTLGLSILFAHKSGSGENKAIPEILSSFFLLFGVGFFAFAALGIWLAYPILRLLHTTGDTIRLAGDYLRIIFAGIPFLAVYNVYSAALRGIGDSRAPFLAILFSSAVNVVLDILFVACLHWGVKGAAAATVISSHAYLWMTAGLSIYAFGIGLANAGLVRLTLFASDMSKGTVSAAMGMLQMLIFTVGIEISKHAWLNGGNGQFNLFNLVNGILWLSLMVIFLKDKQMGNSHEG